MAFGGGAVVHSSRNIYENNTLTLTANVGAFDPTNVATDSGVLSSAAAPPAGAIAIPAGFGPGQGNWTAADVAAVGVTIDDASAVANARIGVAQKALVGNDLQIGIHSLEAGIPAAITVRLDAEHTLSR